jgi:hypothetical protein
MTDCGPFLLIIVVGYVIAAASEIWTIKALNYEYYAEFPTLSAMVLNAYWPIQLVMYYYTRQSTPAPIRKAFPWKAYGA